MLFPSVAMDRKECLQIAATAMAGLFAGNAMYINAADHPARMQLDTQNLRLVWREGFHRAKKFQVRGFDTHTPGISCLFQPRKLGKLANTTAKVYNAVRL